VVTRDGEPLELPAREFVLLRYFLEHPGQVLSRERLLKDVWATPVCLRVAPWTCTSRGYESVWKSTGLVLVIS
jgi:hypothetical protein